jgi:hypothetical protein
MDQNFLTILIRRSDFQIGLAESGGLDRTRFYSEGDIISLVLLPSFIEDQELVVDLFNAYQHDVDQQFTEPVNNFIHVSIMLPFFISIHHNILLKA